MVSLVSFVHKVSSRTRLFIISPTHHDEVSNLFRIRKPHFIIVQHNHLYENRKENDDRFPSAPRRCATSRDRGSIQRVLMLTISPMCLSIYPKFFRQKKILTIEILTPLRSQ